MAASADHIKALVKSHGSGDDGAFYSNRTSGCSEGRDTLTLCLARLR